MDDDTKHPSEGEAPTQPTRAPLARVALVRRRLEVAPPVKVIMVEVQRERRPLPRAASVGGSVWVLRPEHTVEEIPLGD